MKKLIKCMTLAIGLGVAAMSSGCGSDDPAPNQAGGGGGGGNQVDFTPTSLNNRTVTLQKTAATVDFDDGTPSRIVVFFGARARILDSSKSMMDRSVPTRIPKTQ
ncbi:MAG: hypothetical protein FJY37_17735 [Betaproteobacteria bacterium]|nr:hypothetical protein [Betaproteobacteria bacterium]MBM3830312.1 hypothetical protein [Verrucomicrobiota bacterium]